MKDIILKIIDAFNFKKAVRGILAITVIGTACFLTIEGKVSVPSFMLIAGIIITFFFKKDEEEN